MKSRITIDFQGVEGVSTGQEFKPVIRARLEKSDDVRDSLMNAFFDTLQYRSNWLRVDFNVDPEGVTLATIHPVGPDEFEETIETIKSRMDLVKAPREND